MSKNIKNLASFLIIGLMPYAVNIFMLPVYSRFLSKEDFGIIGLAMAALFISSSWSNFQLPGAISRIYFDYEGKERNELVSTLINGSVVVSIIFCSVYIVFSNFLVEMIYGDFQYYWLHVSVVLSVFLSCTNTAFEKLMITQQRGIALLARSLLAQLSSVISGLYFICYLDLGALGFIFSQSLYFLIMVLFSFFLSREEYSFVLKRKYLTEGIKYSFPLVFHSLGGVMFMYSGAFFIKSIIGISALGVFTVADRLSQVAKAVVNSFNNVYSPLYTKINLKHSADNVSIDVNVFNDASQNMWSIVFAVFSSCFVFLASSFVNDYMVGNYEDVYSILLVLVPAYFFRSMFCFSSAPIFFNKDTFYIPIITCISGVIVLLLSYPLIDNFSTYGAAMLVALGFFITFVLSELVSLFKYSVRTFKLNYFFLYSMIFCSNSYLFIAFGSNLFLIDLFLSLVIGVANILFFYHFDIFNFKRSVNALRRING